MKYKNIIFDLDGTLWDSRNTIIDNWNRILLRDELISKPLEIDDLNPYMGLLADDILRDIVPGISTEQLEAIMKEIELHENKTIREKGGRLYPHVAESLAYLEKNLDLYIVSNCQDGYIEAFLDYFGLEDIFKDFESYGRTKQNKASNIKSVIDRNKLNETETVYVGDTQTDFESSKSNRLDFILCAYGFGELETEKPNYIIQDFKDLIPIL